MNTNEIFNTIRDRIMWIEYRPGEVLHENELAEEFGVKKAEIKTILRQLEHEGMLTLAPRVGATISPVDTKLARQAFELRCELEGAIIAICTEKITSDELQELRELCAQQKQALSDHARERIFDLDSRWHATLLQMCKNELLTEIYQKTLHICIRTFNFVFGDPFDQGEELYDFSAALDAMENKDVETARSIAKTHVYAGYLAIRDKAF